MFSVPYTEFMTAKQTLRERVEKLSEEEAAEWLARMEWEATAVEELDENELAEVRESQAEYDRGEAVDGKELMSELGLWRTA